MKKDAIHSKKKKKNLYLLNGHYKQDNHQSLAQELWGQLTSREIFTCLHSEADNGISYLESRTPEILTLIVFAFHYLLLDSVFFYWQPPSVSEWQVPELHHLQEGKYI